MHTMALCSELGVAPRSPPAMRAPWPCCVRVPMCYEYDVSVKLLRIFTPKIHARAHPSTENNARYIRQEVCVSQPPSARSTKKVWLK